MNRRRAGLAALCLLLGVAIVVSALHGVWQPTVGDPNYWANHTGGLFPLVLQAAAGGGLAVGGVALGFDGAVGRLRGADVRAAGVAGVVGGLLGYGPVVRAIATAARDARVVHYGVEAAALALLAVAVAGLVGRYPSVGRLGRYGGGVVAGGFLLLAGAELLDWALLSVEPRSGALSYPPLGLELVGTLALAAGSVVLGAALHGSDDAPRWLGPLLVVAGLLAVPLGVVASLQRVAAAGSYGLAWVVVGGHVAAARPRQADRRG